MQRINMKNVLKYDDLLKIEEFLRENDFDSGNLSVVMNIETQQRLNRINSDYFHKTNGDNSIEIQENVSNVNVKIGNVMFTYKMTGENEDS